VEVLNELGQTVKIVSLGNQSSGKHEYQLNVEKLSTGIYFVKLIAGEASETTKLMVTK
jgi:hypothetical protein